MSLRPEHVAEFEAIVREFRALGRRLERFGADVSQGTADVKGPCLRCSDRGVIVGESADVQSVPCSCEAGRPFRTALAQRDRRYDMRGEPAARFLPNDGNKSGRDRAAGVEEK